MRNDGVLVRWAGECLAGLVPRFTRARRNSRSKRPLGEKPNENESNRAYDGGDKEYRSERGGERFRVRTTCGCRKSQQRLHADILRCSTCYSTSTEHTI